MKTVLFGILIVSTLTVERFLGTSDVALFVISYLFALAGVFLSLRMHASTRSSTSIRTPDEFKAHVLFRDNIERIAVNLLLVFLVLRFSPNLSGHPINEWDAFLYGMGIDKIPEFLREKGVIDKKQLRS